MQCIHKHLYASKTKKNVCQREYESLKPTLCLCVMKTYSWRNLFKHSLNLQENIVTIFNYLVFYWNTVCKKTILLLNETLLELGSVFQYSFAGSMPLILHALRKLASFFVSSKAADQKQWKGFHLSIINLPWRWVSHHTGVCLSTRMSFYTHFPQIQLDRRGFSAYFQVVVVCYLPPSYMGAPAHLTTL